MATVAAGHSRDRRNLRRALTLNKIATGAGCPPRCASPTTTNATLLKPLPFSLCAPSHASPVLSETISVERKLLTTLQFTGLADENGLSEASDPVLPREQEVNSRNLSARSPDIIVIGAGIVGCAVGYELARRGASVQIVDDRQPGMGATQASAGMLAPFTEAKDRNTTFLDLAVRSLDLYDEFVSRVAQTSKMPVGYKRTGTIDVASTDDRMTSLRDIASRLTSRGVALSLLDAAEARAEEPQLGSAVTGALLIGAHGYVRATELTRALVAAARCHGAHVVEGSRVCRIAPREHDLVVETARGSLTAGAVVVTAGSWSGQIGIGDLAARVPVRPVRGQLLHLAWQGRRCGA